MLGVYLFVANALLLAGFEGAASSTRRADGDADAAEEADAAADVER